MTTLDDPGVRALLDKPNHAVVSTLGEDGGIHSTVVWVSIEDGRVAVNSAVGRAWPTNLERNPVINVLVYDEDNPYDYVEVRGTVEATTDGAFEHIDRLAKKYIDKEKYPFLQPGEQRISFFVNPTRIYHRKLR